VESPSRICEPAAGNPYDNAKAERFMRTLKEEEVNGKTYASIDAPQTDIGAFLENVYNRGRLHSALGYKPPGRVRSRTPPNRNRLKGHKQSFVTQTQCLSRGVQFKSSLRK
jgi:transposase InsO family protein